MREKTAAAEQKPPRITLTYYYWIGIISVTLGIAIVALLNLFTPLQIIQTSTLQQEATVSWDSLFAIVLPPLFLLLLPAYGFVLLSLKLLLRPIVVCLSIDKAGGKSNVNQIRVARKKLLNLHNLFARMNILLWLALSLLVGATAVIKNVLDYTSAIILSARASIVGLISSSIATLRIKIASEEWPNNFTWNRWYLGGSKLIGEHVWQRRRQHNLDGTFTSRSQGNP